MPRISEKKRDKLFASIYTARFVESADARGPREKAWNDARKRYDPAYIDKTKIRTPPYVKRPYVWRTVNTQVEQLLTAAEANGTFVRARSTTPDNGPVGEVVTQALDNNFRAKTADIAFSNEEGLERVARFGMLYGNGWTHCEYFEQPGSWGVKYVPLDPFDCFPDWKHNRWIMVRRKVTLAEMGDLAKAWSREVPVGVGPDNEVITGPADGGRALRAFRALERQIKQRGQAGTISDLHSHANTRQVTLGRVSDTDEGADVVPGDEDPSNVRVTLIQYHETRHDGLVAMIVPGFGTSDDDLLFVREQNPYGACTIVPFVPHPVDNEVYGYGKGEIVGHLAEAMDYTFRSGLRVIAKTADAPLLHRRRAKLGKSFLRNPSGKTAEVDDVTGDAAYLPMPAQANVAFDFATKITQEAADMATGESEQRRGSIGKSSATATAAAIAEAGSNNVDRALFRRWRKFIEQLGHVTLQIMRTHITEDKAIPILGRDSETFLRLKPEFLKSTFSVEFGGSANSMNVQQNIAGLLNLAQTFAPMQVLDLPAVARKVIRLMGEPDPDALLAIKTPRPQVSARHENIAIFQFGQEAEPHPEDNHQEHLALHFTEFQKIQQSVPNHPALQIMQRHIQGHMFVLQQQQGAAMQEGGGAPGGAPNIAQGGPGQALTGQGQASQIDAQRQVPNQQAAGQAPGGIAPNRQVGQIAQGGPR